MAAPPVARMSRVRRCFMRAWVASRVGVAMQETAPSGAPAWRAARSTTRTVSAMHPTALGWGEKTMGLPAFMQIMAL